MGETRIIAFGGGSDGQEPQDEAVAGDALLLQSDDEAEEAPWYESEEHEAAQAPDRVATIARSVAIVLALAWTGWFAWANLDAIATRPSPREATDLVTQWCVPLLLISVLWLLAMRSSHREAARFGGTARILADESAHLEHRLKSVNGELSLAREFIASQARDLETLGRLATERLSENAARLEELIRDNGSRIDSISSVSAAALDNMEKLRGQLPVIASSTKDVTNTIAGAGRTAQDQLDGLVSGLERLEQAGTASEAKISALGGRIDETLDRLARRCDAVGEAARERFDAIDAHGDEVRLALDKHEVEALAAIQTRAEALKEEIEISRKSIDANEAESLASLRTRLTALREEGSGVSRTLVAQQDRMAEHWNEALARIEGERERIDSLLETASTAFTGDFAERLRQLEKGLHDLDNDLDDDTLESLQKDYPRLYRFGGLTFEMEYLPRKRRVVMHSLSQTKGAKLKPQHLPRWNGWKVELDERGRRTVLR